MFKKDTLKDAFFFLNNSAPEVLERIEQRGESRSVDSGSRLYWEGDACTHIAFVLQGEIRVFKTGESGREITLYEIGPGETCILNASCILSNQGYPAEAVTLSDVKILLLPAQVFQELVHSSPDFRTFVFSQLNDRLVTVFQLIDEIVFGNLDQRLCEYLVEKSEDNILQSTHQIIANDLGTSREVISRLLKDMEREGKLELKRNRVTLLTLV